MKKNYTYEKHGIKITIEVVDDKAFEQALEEYREEDFGDWSTEIHTKAQAEEEFEQFENTFDEEIAGQLDDIRYYLVCSADAERTLKEFEDGTRTDDEEAFAQQKLMLEEDYEAMLEFDNDRY